MEERQRTAITNVLIGCCFMVFATIAICAIIIMVTYFKLNPVDGFNKPAKEEKREDISIMFDGRMFTLTNNFGKVVREIAAHRQAYETDRHTFGQKKKIENIDDYLNQPYRNQHTSVDFYDRIQSHVAISVFYENDGIRHDENYKIGDAKEASILLTVLPNEKAVIDNKIVIEYNKTTKEDLLKSIPNSELLIQDEIEKEYFGEKIRTVYAKYKGHYLYITFTEGSDISISILYDERQRF